MKNFTERVKDIKGGPNARDYFTALYEICIEPFMLLSFFIFLFAVVFTVGAMLVPPPTFIIYVIVSGYVMGLPAVLSLAGAACQVIYRKAVEVSERE